jgi:N-acetyl-gamma-glutamylphosphate reductase
VDGVFGLRLVALGHNLERGAAGAAVANAELVSARLATLRRGTALRAVR